MSSLELASETPLHQLLRMLQDTQSQIDGIDWTRQDPLTEAGKIKVDSYKFIYDKLSAQFLYFEQLAAYYTKAKKSAESQLEGFESHLKWVMETQKVERAEGNDFAVILSQSSFCDVSAECLPRHRVIFKDWVKVKYSWSLTAIREALDGEDEEARAKALQIAKVGYRSRPKFELIKVERKKSNAKNSAKGRSKSSARQEPAPEPSPAELPATEGAGNIPTPFDPLRSDTLLYADPFAEHEHDAFFDHEYVAEESEAADL